MNSERVQLRTDSLDDNYGDDHESRDSLNIQSPRGRRGHSHTRIPLSDPSPIERVNTNNCCNRKRILVLFLSFVGLILCLILSFEIGLLGTNFVDYMEEGEEHMESNTSYPEAIELTTSMGSRFHSSPHTCSDFYNPEHGDFGCCKIYDHRGSYNITWDRILKEDLNGSNCPTYEQLIHNYVDYVNKYLSPINCTELSCCKLNYRIDLSFRENGSFPRGNFMDPAYDIEIPVSSDYYSCRPLKVIIAYQNYYRDPSEWGLILAFCILILILCLSQIK